MKVSALQSFVKTLLVPLHEAGASEKVKTEIQKTVDCLTPFGEMEIGAFADFLAQAHEYRTTGILPVSTGRGRGSTAKAKAPKASPLSVDEAAARVRSLYERAADPNLPYSAIDTELDALNKGLDKNKMIAVAQTVGIAKPGKTKAAALTEIKRMIEALKASVERTDFRAVPADAVNATPE